MFLKKYFFNFEINHLWVAKLNYGPSMAKGGPGITRLRCTKFNEGCTKGPKMLSEVGIDPQSLCYGFLNEIMDYPC